MNYSKLLDLAADLGYELAMCGAETFRVEESVSLVLASYGIEAEVFAIPNCLTVSIICDDGYPMTRMRRIGYHGNDLDGVERFTGLSRAICSRKPDPETAQQWLDKVRGEKKTYRLPMYFLGNFLGAAGFAVFYGGNLGDGLYAGICGILVGIINLFMDRMKVNSFFRTLAAAFPMALLAYALGNAGITEHPDAAIIGALMILVPGLLFTNAMRDIIFGDTNSGVMRIVQVLLIAVALATGTAAAWNVISFLLGAPEIAELASYSFLQQILPCLVGCFGFSILFNIFGPGMLLCILGGLLSWAAYCLNTYLGGDHVTGCFWGALVAALYSEIMARVRKCPAISYLLVAIFPLIPGAGIYYTMNYVVRGEMEMFAKKGMETIAVAGVIAVGLLLVSTAFRLWAVWKRSLKRA